MWKNDDCPCVRDCPDRVPACHGSCPKYKEWSAKRDAAKKAAVIRHEGRCMTQAGLKAHWKRCRKDRTGAFKKFSQ